MIIRFLNINELSVTTIPVTSLLVKDDPSEFETKELLICKGNVAPTAGTFSPKLILAETNPLATPSAAIEMTPEELILTLKPAGGVSPVVW